MQPCNYYQTIFCKIYKVKLGTSIGTSFHICDLVAHLTVFNGCTSDSLKFHALHSVKYNRFMYFHLYYWRYRMREASEFSYDHRAFIFEFKVQTSCILSQFQLGTGGLVRASASSILREGDWSHVGYLIFPHFPAHPARAWIVPGLSRFFLLEFHDSVHDWCSENAKRLI